jgi:Family of unknown function (DUF6535)
LFSAAVAVLVAVSIQDLNPSSQFYLANIQQLLAGNVSQVTPLPSPPPHAILVNSLWFLSLSISLVCGVLVTSQQHWIRSYMMVTQAPQIPPRRRARIHAFRHRGIMDSGFFRAFDITGTLIHISLFLFFIGLLIYLFNINFTLFCTVAWFLGASATAYLAVALMPIFRINSPYGSPLSDFLYWPFSGVLYAILRILNSVIRTWDTSEHLHRLKTIHSKGFASAFLDSALKQSPDIECQIMDRTIDIMDDRELEWAFERFCTFSSSGVVGLPLAKSKWSFALEAFSDITLLSDSVSERDRIRRLGLCMKVADLAHLPNAGLHILRQIFDRQHHVLQSIEMGDILRTWNRSNQEISFCTQILISGIIANVPSHDDRWIALASDLLGKSEDEIRDYHDRGDDNVLLANLIHITRQIIRSWKNKQGEAPSHDSFAYMFRSLSNFAIRNTLPELQDDFLTLWNGINYSEIPGNLRNLYDVLTQGRDNASAVPTVPDSNFPPDSISHPPDPPSPVANNPTAEPFDELSPRGTSNASHNIPQSAASPQSAPMLPERHGLSRISHATNKVLTRATRKTRRRAAVTPGNTPDISPKGQSTLRHEPNGNMPPVDENSSTDVGIGPESLPPTLTSVPSSATPQAASILPNGASTILLGAYDGAQDHSDPSPENRHRSAKSA